MVRVDVEMLSKGVPTAGSPLFVGHALSGYVVDGAYSSVAGKGIGFGLMTMDKLLTLHSDTNDKTVTMKPYGAFPNLAFQCIVEVSL